MWEKKPLTQPLMGTVVTAAELASRVLLFDVNELIELNLDVFVLYVWARSLITGCEVCINSQVFQKIS